MQITIHYGARSFGNAYDNGDFDVTVEKATWPADSLELGFRFAKPTSGRGANWENMGWVSRANLKLSAVQARKIAAAILWYLEDQRAAPMQLKFEAPKNAKKSEA